MCFDTRDLGSKNGKNIKRYRNSRHTEMQLEEHGGLNMRLVKLVKHAKINRMLNLKPFCKLFSLYISLYLWVGTY